MFLYAYLVLYNLESQTTRDGFMNELEPSVFPQGLDQA